MTSSPSAQPPSTSGPGSDAGALGGQAGVARGWAGGAVVGSAAAFRRRHLPGAVHLPHRLITADMMFRGTVNQTAVYPREVLKHALKLNAAAVILSHNHPSGNPEPSEADLSLTRTLQAVLGQVDIRVLDHIIVAGSQQYSFAQHGLL